MCVGGVGGWGGGDQQQQTAADVRSARRGIWRCVVERRMRRLWVTERRKTGGYTALARVPLLNGPPPLPP